MSECKFGCGRKGIKQFKDGTWCCSKNSSMCPNIRKKVSKSSIGKELCKETREKISNSIKKRHRNNLNQAQNHSKFMRDMWSNEENRICMIKSQKEGWTEEVRNIQSKKIKEVWKDEILIEIQRESQSKAWKNPDSKLGTEEYRSNMGKVMSEKWKEVEFRKMQIIRLSKLKKNYPFFCSNEKVKEDENTYEVLVRCKTCNKWFKPTYNQLYGRIFALENINGNRQQFFYCCEDHKNMFKEKDLNKREQYRRKVLIETNRSIKLYGHKIKNLRLRGDKYHLDHKYSIYEGYKNNIDVLVIGHWKNLEIISKKKNLKKSSNCSIDIHTILGVNND